LSGGARFFLEKGDDLFFARRLLNQPLPPTNLQKNVLQIDSSSVWGAITNFPCKLRLKNFPHSGVPPPGYVYDLLPQNDRNMLRF